VRRQRWQILNAALAEMELLPEVELAQLNSLLARVVAETAVFAAKSSAWAFQTRQQHGLKPPIAPLAPLAQFIEWRMDLGAFRDDAHLATWRKQYDTSPHDWEVMARIWQDQAKTPAGVSDDLARRGFSKLETAVSLDKLINLGWLTQEHDAYRMTEEGNWVRQTAEQQTNNIFYGPWSTLTPSELKAVQQLLKTVSSKIN
jgi:predicted transcriptional regulator